MDTIAHGLWASLIGRAIRLRTAWWVLALSSMGPDAVWLPFTAWHWSGTGNIIFFELPYQISHSLVVWLVLTALASIKWRWAAAVTWPWALHILIDIPGHIHTQTPFLWPVSDFTLRGGWEWLDARWMVANYALLVFLGIGLFIQKKFSKK